MSLLGSVRGIGVEPAARSVRSEVPWCDAFHVLPCELQQIAKPRHQPAFDRVRCRL